MDVEDVTDLIFKPMLPRVYDIMLPSIDARLNFINVGQKYTAFVRHGKKGGCDACAHKDILLDKTRLLTAILTKLLDVNGILDRKDD